MQSINKKALIEKLKNDPTFLELYNYLAQESYSISYGFKDFNGKYDINISSKNFISLINYIDHYTYNYSEDELIKLINQFVFSLIVMTNIWQAILSKKINENRPIPIVFGGSYWLNDTVDNVIALDTANFTTYGHATAIETYIHTVPEKGFSKQHLIVRILVNYNMTENDNYLKNVIFQVWNSINDTGEPSIVAVDKININFLRQEIDKVL